MALTISELAREGGVGVETVRYYQRRGLLFDPRPARIAGSARGHRHYGAGEVRRLRFIRAAQDAGFTLEEIAELLQLDATQDRARAREMAAVRIAALDERITRLQQARAALAQLAGACAVGSSGPCPILEAFESEGA